MTKQNMRHIREERVSVNGDTKWKLILLLWPTDTGTYVWQASIKRKKSRKQLWLKCTICMVSLGLKKVRRQCVEHEVHMRTLLFTSAAGDATAISTWSSEPRYGLAVGKATELPSFSVFLRIWVLFRPRQSYPRSPTLQPSPLPTELILQTV